MCFFPTCVWLGWQQNGLYQVFPSDSQQVCYLFSWMYKMSFQDCVHFSVHFLSWWCLCWLSGSQTALKVFLPSLTLRLASQTDVFHKFSLLVFQDGPQRKKRKSEVGEVDKQLDILAIGTAVGSILLYSTVKGELQSKLVSNALFITCYQTLMVSVSLGQKILISKLVQYLNAVHGFATFH